MADRTILFETSQGAHQGVSKSDRILAGGFVGGPSGFLSTVTINSSSGNIDVVTTNAGSNLTLTAVSQIILNGTSVLINCDVDANSHLIHNVLNPVTAQDAATKNYVDTLGGSFIKKDGSVAFTGDESMGGHKLTNVTDPAAAQDAATKNYVDTADALFIKKDGSVAFTGDESMGGFKLTNLAAPASTGDATNKTYVDTQEALDLRLDGTRPMTGALNMNTHLINNVVDPVSAQDAATKNYVDATAGGSNILTVVNVASGSFSTGSGTPSTLPSSAFSFTVGATTLVAIDVFFYFEIGQTNFDNAVQFFLALKNTVSLVSVDIWSGYQGVQANGTPSANGQTGYSGVKRYIASFAAGTHNFDLESRVSGGGSYSITYPLNIVASKIG